MDLVASGKIPRPGGDNSIWLCPEAVDQGWQYYWSYGMNMGLSVEQGNQNNGMPDKITGVGDPATMVLMADGPGNYCAVFPSKFPDGYNPVARHNRYVNICFVDGHAAAVLGSYIGIGTGLIEHADIRWHPPASTWNSAQ
jgi:prepilin-type processing-associated H-X9-DG protein